MVGVAHVLVAISQVAQLVLHPFILLLRMLFLLPRFVQSPGASYYLEMRGEHSLARPSPATALLWVQLSAINMIMNDVTFSPLSVRTARGPGAYD